MPIPASAEDLPRATRSPRRSTCGSRNSGGPRRKTAIVSLVQALTWEMSGPELRRMAELMSWVKIRPGRRVAVELDGDVRREGADTMTDTDRFLDRERG